MLKLLKIEIFERTRFGIFNPIVPPVYIINMCGVRGLSMRANLIKYVYIAL